MKRLIYRTWVWLFARTRFATLNRFLYSVSLHGLGILNFESLRASGELRFLKQVFRIYGADAGTTAVVLDVGANIGNYAREVLAFNGAAQVYCFEPHPLNVAKLRSAVGARATVVPCAVGSQSGMLELFDYSDTDGSSHASVYKEVFEQIHKKAHVSHQVDVVTIDDFLEQHNIDHVVLLKIDTEGHELAALSGASRSIANKRIDIVHFEFNEMNIASRTFIGDFFQALPGFRFYRLLSDGWLALSGSPLENIFAYQNIVAIRDGSPAHVALI